MASDSSNAPPPQPQRINAPLRLPPVHMLSSLPKLVQERVRSPGQGSFAVNPVAAAASTAPRIVPLPFPLQAPAGSYYYPVHVLHPVSQLRVAVPRQGLKPVDWGRAQGRVTKQAEALKEESWVPSITSDYTREELYKEETRYCEAEVGRVDSEVEFELDRAATEPPDTPGFNEDFASNADVDDFELEVKRDNVVVNKARRATTTPPQHEPPVPVRAVKGGRVVIGQSPPPPAPAPAPAPTTAALNPPQQASSASNVTLPVNSTPERVRIPRGVNLKIAAYAKHTYPYAEAKAKADAIVACTRDNRARPCSHGDATCSGGKLHCPGNPGDSCERKYLNKHKLIQHLVDTRNWCPDCHTQLSRSDKKSLETHRQSTGCIAALYRDGPALDRPLEGINKPVSANQPLREQ